MLHLSRTFSLPTPYLARDGMLATQFWSHEGFPEPNDIDSYRVGFYNSALAWSFNPQTNASRAVFTVTARRDHDRGTFASCLKKIQEFPIMHIWEKVAWANLQRTGKLIFEAPPRNSTTNLSWMAQYRF